MPALPRTVTGLLAQARADGYLLYHDGMKRPRTRRFLEYWQHECVSAGRPCLTAELLGPSRKYTHHPTGHRAQVLFSADYTHLGRIDPSVRRGLAEMVFAQSWVYGFRFVEREATPECGGGACRTAYASLVVAWLGEMAPLLNDLLLDHAR